MLSIISCLLLIACLFVVYLFFDNAIDWVFYKLERFTEKRKNKKKM